MNKRMILVEKLGKELAKNCRLNNWDLGFKAAIDIVKGYNEWINVDDCLPDERLKVLAWHNRKEKFFIATYDRDLKVWLNDGKPYSSEFLYSITRWMYLPSSPSEEQL